LALSWVTPFPALADALLDGLKTLPGNVEDVRIGGTWDSGGKSGAYRILVARSGGDAVTARMFVQWLVYNDDGTATLQDTIEIKELADLKVDVVDFTSESDQDGLSVFIQTLNPNGSDDLNYELRVASPTQYKFRQASN
jgi:hypothetical protein